jgi:hypothetical protein
MKGVLRLVLILSIFVAATGVAFAQNGDTLNIGGQVPLTLTLGMTPDPAADNLDLSSADGPVTATIAAITVDTNNTAGWELWVFAANADGTNTSMQNADGNEFVYTITYTGLGSPGAANITDTGLLVGEAGLNVVTDSGNLQIAYTQSTAARAGYYSDQLAIVLRAK